MSNLFDYKKVFNKTSRNGFDLSQKVLFSAKAGQFLPVGVYEVLPGDTFKMNLRSFIRTIPVNSAAYTRINNYFDVYYVRTNDLWDKFDLFALQLEDNVNRAQNIAAAQRVSEYQPYFTRKQVISYLKRLKDDNLQDCFGYKKYITVAKLLEYLGYGTFISPDSANPDEYTIYTISDDDNLRLNPFPLLSYQFIWQNNVRNSQWEESAPYTCNLNYITGVDDLQLDTDSLSGLFDDLFSLKYTNWAPDYFFGLLPRQQFGDTASISIALNAADTVTTSDSGFFDGEPHEQGNEISLATAGSNGVRKLILNEAQKQLDFRFTKDDLEKFFTMDNSEISAIAIRQLEYVQKYKEILQFGNRDIKNVLKQIYGVDISSEDAHLPQWLGGYSSTLDINEVVNSTLTEGNEATIRGKGLSDGHSGEINFTAKYHGIILVMYHSQPVLEYSTSGISRLCQKSKFTDYAIPIFDKLGLQSVTIYDLCSDPNFLFVLSQRSKSKILGYGPRYLEYKTNYDKMLGSFRENYDFWGCPFNDTYLTESLLMINTSADLPGLFNANFFRTNPRILDTLFSVKSDSTVRTDPFLINFFIECYVVRNLDRDGLPY